MWLTKLIIFFFKKYELVERILWIGTNKVINLINYIKSVN